VTIAATFRVETGNLTHTATQTLDVDTTVTDVLAAALAELVFLNPLFALPFALAVYQTVAIHKAEESGAADRAGVSGVQVTVQFDTPASGKSHLRHVSVTVTDADGMVVSETRKVRISTVSHQGPGGHGRGHGGHGGEAPTTHRSSPEVTNCAAQRDLRGGLLRDGRVLGDGRPGRRRRPRGPSRRTRRRAARAR
jgi:hypothetical protein